MAERDQQFTTKQQWINKGRSWLTRRGSHVHAVCFDMRGRPVLSGKDFMRAEEDDAFPVRWLWPNQVAKLAAGCDFEAAVAADEPDLDD